MTGESLPKHERHLIPRMLCTECLRTFTVYPSGFLPYIREVFEFVKFAIEAYKLKTEKNREKQEPRAEHFSYKE